MLHLLHYHNKDQLDKYNDHQLLEFFQNSKLSNLVNYCKLSMNSDKLYKLIMFHFHHGNRMDININLNY